MKKLILFSLLTIMVSAVSAQKKRSCGTLENLEYLKKQDPTLAGRMEKDKNYLEQFIKNSMPASNEKVSAVINIPVVVHVVYNTSGQNISDAQVQSQIDVLNEDFNRKNADSTKTPAAFKSVASSPKITFCLAKIDPNGNSTNGITRTATTVTSFSTDDAVKHANSGGCDSWNTAKYFNIWVCPLGNYLLGYAQFPGSGSTSTYGVVILYNAFGRLGNVAAPFNKGRSATHEIGHSFALSHIWGDDGGACSGTDGMNDTPNQADATYNAPTFPLKDFCSPNSPGIMFMNYMDYSDDGSMNMFTANQSTQMVAAVNAYYPGVKTSTVCNSPVDAGVSSIISPVGNNCSGTINPVVTISNYGGTTLTKTNIVYKIDNGGLNTYAWTGSLVNAASTNVTLASTTIGAGSHTITVYTSIPNGVSSDANTANDSQTGSFTVVGPGSAGLSESFEGGVFPPAGWIISNPDNDTTWIHTKLGAYTGSSSMVIDNYEINVYGRKDDITTTSVDLTKLTSPVLTFQLAYQLYTSPSAPIPYSDTLEVFISNDCGATKTMLYKKYSTALTTTSPVFNAGKFAPSGPSQWRMETIDLSPYKTSTKALIIFRNISQYENYLFIDDINIASSTSIANQRSAGFDEFSLYPNPSGNEVNIKSKSLLEQNVNVKIYNLLGELMYSNSARLGGGNSQHLDISTLPVGIFYVQLQGQNSNSIIKLIHSK